MGSHPKSKVLPAVLIASLLVLAAGLIKNHIGQATRFGAQIPDRIAPQADAPPDSTHTPEFVTSKETATEAASLTSETIPVRPDPIGGNADIQQQDYVDKRIVELQNLLATKEPDSLVVVLSELSNPNRAIRAAALEAIIQFDSLDAIPTLADAVSRTDDPAEKAELLEAIHFLQLPTATEVARQRRERGEAVPSHFRRSPR